MLINIHMSYFVNIPNLEVEKYTNYFLNDFIPSRKFEDNLPTNLIYVQYFKKDFYTDTVIKELDFMLQEKFNFPPIEYFSIFKHSIGQQIHIDGIHTPRYASLNLPLKGFESTKMIFYKKIIEVDTRIADANYYKETEVTPVTELLGCNQWVLVNSGVPHNITNVDLANPRYTVCIRFYNNPTFSQLVDQMNGPA